MASIATVSFEDNDTTLGSSRIRLKSGTTDAKINTFITAAKAVTLGPVRRATKTLDIAGFTPVTTAAPKTAQWGNRWRVKGIGANGKKRSFSIPTADTTTIGTVGSDAMDIVGATSKGLTLKNAIEAVWADKAGGNMTVTGIFFKNYKDRKKRGK